MPLIFVVGGALGFTHNDGVGNGGDVRDYGQTIAVVTTHILNLSAGDVVDKHQADKGVLGGIIAGDIAASMCNHFYRINLP